MAFLVCPACGTWEPERSVEDRGDSLADALCRTCGSRWRFRRLPMAVVTGASGVGKTTVCLELTRLLHGCVVLETDILWGAVPASPDDEYRSYWRAWLRLVMNIHQAGRSVVLCGSVRPDQLDDLPERRYIGDIHTVALVASDAAIEARLRARPGWREASGDATVSAMLAFNAWFRDHAASFTPPADLIDTTGHDPATTAEQVAALLRARLT